uniref:Large ribosomal subunit protein bL32c n=1 Tax=Ceratostigma willmottianum TaxID=2054445 RepID=A0A411JQ13_9CARY|nr:ribosomal protein L32 [Ceratostigma willmottianum]YP_010689904.1 ribosomal protein L32 [Ceratostigma plumbaginoides]YP_010689986.1 ribosomal protein L32 [Ceratostigma griffithii]YP_010690068.1 ribosomal protein L32 [Ceratostigma minus]QBC67159.1 ribosomal protein L32 [Ceratostigma willmottianum]WBR75613.1 ribosomal protein L32 [Ceratostigma plumbaginoides]WBR75695.1 ribosomal protein L32 [Ceratostigma plumbaginoides]WBR75777.1 ribosomal protein L32 [Ceratostigma griffithii]WBR75859.1 rib
MAVPKKHTSISKKRIRKNLWKRKGFSETLKAFSLARSLSTGNSKTFFCMKKKITKYWTNMNRSGSKKLRQNGILNFKYSNK